MPIIFLAVILKIPVLYGMWLIYWAVKDEPELEDLPGDADDHSFRRFRRSPTKPKGPRRGPHGGAAEARARLPAGRPQANAGDRAEARPRHGRARAARAHARRQLGTDSTTTQEGTDMGQPVVHFEVVGKDFEKLKSFYSELAGWSYDEPPGAGQEGVPPYGLVPREGNTNPDGIGIGGGVGVGPEGYEGHVTFYIEVPDVGRVPRPGREARRHQGDGPGVTMGEGLIDRPLQRPRRPRWSAWSRAADDPGDRKRRQPSVVGRVAPEFARARDASVRGEIPATGPARLPLSP